MDEPATTPAADRHVTGPLSGEVARELLDQGAALIATGEYPGSFAVYQRVVGFDDPEITGAALLGMAQARYRMDDEDAAIRTWEAVLELPDTAATYHAWRNVAAARVRDGDLNGAIGAYREADRRAPAGDKPEIANRLGWLAKETGNVRASRRYFARGRGSVLPIATYAILGATVAVSLAAAFSTDGGLIYRALELDKVAVAAGEFWRLLTVTLVHGGVEDQPAFALMHLGFNMYALYICGPVVEQIYGPVRALAFYLIAALGASIATFALADDRLVVGASGAIFGYFGILFAASRLHLPMLDRRGRALVGQVGSLIVINVIIGFSLGFVDNIAHLGGLATGFLLGVAIAPGNVPTLRSMWAPGTNRQLSTRIIGGPIGMVGGIALIVVLFAVGFRI